MKSASPLALALCAAAAAITLNSQLTDAQLSCYDLGPGQACTNYLGEESRCSQTDLCMTSLKECASSATLLQSCSPSYTSLKYLKFCYPMFGEGKPMQCMEPENIDTLVKRSQCVGRVDGTACNSAYTEPDINTGLSANVYKEEGFCEDGYCVSTFFTVCNDGNTGASCTAKGVLAANLRQFKGTCVKRTPYRSRCNITDNGVILGSATILVAAAPVPTTAAPTRTPTPTTTRTPTPTRTPTKTPTSTSGADSDPSGINSLFTLSPETSGSTASSAERPLASAAVCAAALLSATVALMAF